MSGVATPPPDVQLPLLVPSAEGITKFKSQFKNCTNSSNTISLTSGSYFPNFLTTFFLIQDTKDAKKKGLSKLQNLSNVIKAKQSLAKENALKNVMGSIDSINEKSNNLIEYFLDLIKVGGGNDNKWFVPYKK